MTTENSNPFVLPGFGQSGESGKNPLLASMEMMSQAWQGLAGSGMAGSPLAPPTSLEEMDRRIADLKIVENWLRMNLSMLTSTVQGLEVQRATIGTLKSFMDAATGAGAPAQASGRPAGAAAGSAKGSAKAAESSAANAAQTPAAAQAWWNMLQKQFDTLAAATTATMQGAKAVKEAASPEKTATAEKPAAKTATKTSPRKRAH